VLLSPVHSIGPMPETVEEGPGATGTDAAAAALPTEAAESGVVAGRAPYVEVSEDPS